MAMRGNSVTAVTTPFINRGSYQLPVTDAAVTVPGALVAVIDLKQADGGLTGQQNSFRVSANVTKGAERGQDVRGENA
jgi:hypothetical protein